MLSEELIKEQGLNETQAAKINEAIDSELETVRTELVTKANTDAERILEGAAAKVQELTGIQREKGQKLGEYFTFAGITHANGKLESEKRKLEEQRNALDTEREELKEKMKGSGDGILKSEHEELDKKYRALQEKEAEFDRVREGDFENKYTSLLSDNTKQKQENAFNGVKPAFPDTVNEYEVKAKWSEFKSAVLETHDIVFDDTGEAWAVDKENEFKKTKLSELVSKDETIAALKKGRKQEGLGVKKLNKEIDGVPFKVTSEDPKEIQKQIREYLTSKGLKLTDPEWAKQFSELNTKIKQETAKK